MSIPGEIIERLRETPNPQKKAEGRKICIEIIQQIMEMKGVAGIHMMAYRQEETAAEILEAVGYLLTG